MKRILSVILAAVLILSCVACGQKETVPTWQEQYDLGIRYLSEGNYEEAILAFNAAIEIDPKQADAYIGLADAYVAQGDFDSAAAVLAQALDVVEDISIIQAKLDEVELAREAANAPIQQPENEPETEPEPIVEPESEPNPEPEPNAELEPEVTSEPKPTPTPETVPTEGDATTTMNEPESSTTLNSEPVKELTVYITSQEELNELALRGDADSITVVRENLGYYDDNLGITSLDALRKLNNLTTLYLSKNEITDISALGELRKMTDIMLTKNDISDISALRGLTSLTALNLEDNNIADISALSGLANLKNLTLGKNKISDISALSGLTNLEALYLQGNNISDISVLGGLSNLKTLNVNNTLITQQQVDDLQAQLPNCEIIVRIHA